MASQTTVLLRTPFTALAPHHPTTVSSGSAAFSCLPTLVSCRRSAHIHRLGLSLTKAKYLCLSQFPKHSQSRRLASVIRVSETLPEKPSNAPDPDQELLSGSTRTVTTLYALAMAASKIFALRIFSLALPLKEPLLRAAGPAIFASINSSPNTPLTVVAAGMAKWLDLYSGVLMVRVLLSWFPNIPWDRQPLSAIRDLCDPYLNLFRNILPPIFDTLDVSPLLAFGVLGTLASILNSSRRSS